jgi:betaine-aldehyde dehydrogenase
VLNVVCGDRGTGRALVEHPTPQLVAITGSIRAGMQVAESASKDVKRVHLELGGKAPVVVFDDADVAAAAEAIAGAGYFNAGQDCTAATRVLVAPRLHDDFVAALSEQAKNTKVGLPDDAEAALGPVNNANQLAHVSGFVDRLPDHAVLGAGGARSVGDLARGFYYDPTVVSGLTQDDEAVQNEIFGPVITVQRFTDEDEAIRWANGTKYGLRSRHARLRGPRLRLRVDQHPHPARRRDAARRVQAVRLRQGPLDVRHGGLHAHQARDGQPRLLTPSPVVGSAQLRRVGLGRGGGGGPRARLR